MSVKLKSALAAIGIALMFVALIGCDSQSTPAVEPEPPAPAAPAASTPAAESEPAALADLEVPAPVVEPEGPPPTAPEEPASTVESDSPAPAGPEASAPVVEPEAPPPADSAAPAPAVEPEPAAPASSAATATEAPLSEPDASLSFDPSVVRGTLSNGLSYYIRHNEEPRDRAQVALVVKAGSILEEENQRGLAHFVEHMAFNGTARFAKQEIVDYLESIGSTFGPDLNARTGFDDTLYWLEIPTDDPEVTETAFQILSDWAYAVSFEPVEVKLERGVVLGRMASKPGGSTRACKTTCSH